jgi:hypothetical protein
VVLFGRLGRSNGTGALRPSSSFIYLGVLVHDDSLALSGALLLRGSFRQSGLLELLGSLALNGALIVNDSLAFNVVDIGSRLTRELWFSIGLVVRFYLLALLLSFDSLSDDGTATARWLVPVPRCSTVV